MISNLNFREPCKEIIKKKQLLTFPCLYILDVSLYSRFKCVLTHVEDVNEYDTRSRNILRMHQHRTVLYEQLPSQVGCENN